MDMKENRFLLSCIYGHYHLVFDDDDNTSYVLCFGSIMATSLQTSFKSSASRSLRMSGL